MRILLIEDTRTGRTATTRLLAQYGDVRAARTIEEARRLSTGWHFDAVVTDLNLGDGRRWQDNIRDVVDLAAGRPIAAHTTQVYREMQEEFASLFSGFDASLFGKQDERELQGWLQSQRRDESGHYVQSMDQGTAASEAEIRRIVAEYAVEVAKSWGVPLPVQRNARNMVECLVSWQRLAKITIDVSWKTMVAIMVAGLVTWLGRAILLWSGAGW